MTVSLLSNDRIFPTSKRPIMVVWVTNVLVVNCFIMQSIPKSFLYYLRDELELEDDNEKAVILRDKRGQSWVIKLDNVKLQFKDGWEKFCQEHNMEVGDFVVFRHVGDLVFDVLIFDPTTCEREFPIPDAPLELMAVSSNHHSHLINNPPEG